MKNSDMPAMPQERDLWVEGIGICPTNGTGLTKREYFAGLAMQGILAGTLAWSSGTCGGSCRLKPGTIASSAVEQADILLAELERAK